MRTRNRADLAAGLRRLADAVAVGRHPLPRLGTGPRQHGGGITVPPVVHDLLCGWRIRIRLDTQPPLSLCGGCGLTVPDPTTDPTTDTDTTAGQEPER
jgi:hypothetical protein